MIRGHHKLQIDVIVNYSNPLNLSVEVSLRLWVIRSYESVMGFKVRVNIHNAEGANFVNSADNWNL